jgi:predicted RNase H-like HicB family nuclease
VSEFIKPGLEDATMAERGEKMKASVKTTVHIPIEIKKEPHYFLYLCPALDMWSVGKTKAEAERKLREDVQLLLARCSRYTTLDKVLSDCGLTTVEVRA